ncbi:PREDICTED: uncharacterized protein LOC105618193 [Atta cephalotes]|uniref:Odorant receptor n=1 Tax=Atta cephalotes TaxID=12957 RepID=A0A158NC69_ATTCE|nr:PREDICTED: uncharacterized protein LOC105618193 [Atta cephalotes]
MQSLTMINVLIESFKSCDAVRDGLDILRLIESCMHAWSNIVFPRIYMKKIAINLNSAIDDWSSPFMKKESRIVMMGYARAGRLIALTHLIAGTTAGALWFISVFLSNKQKAAITDNDTVATWNFVIPSTCLYKGVSYSTYKILFMMQVIQGSLILISECACDSFFFGITMHLCGQLELLGIQFTESNKKHYDEKRHRNVLGPLVKRHCQLIALTRNIEDAFNINILLRLLIISVVIASSVHLSLIAIMSSNDDIAYAMTLVKHLTVPIGAWPLQEYNKFALLRHILSSFGLSVVVIVQYLELYYNCTSATANLDALTLFSCGILALTKIIWFRIYADNLICNYSSAMNDYVTIDTEEKRIIMRNHAFWGRIICIIALLISYVDSVIFIVGHAQLSSEETKINITIFGHQAGYAIPSTCTLAHFHISTDLYLVIFILQYIYLVIMCISNHGSDSVFLHIVLHVCGQLEILKANFINFDITSPKVYERFNTLILRHDHLIRMTRKLAEIIRFVLMVQLFISSMLIIIVGFQFIIALTTNDYGMMSKSFLVLSAFLIQLTLYSIVGDYLKMQMEEVAQSVYHSFWYDLPIKVTKNIIFIMMWTQFPIKLQAGYFVVVDLGTYMSILKTSISYLSVLRVMIEADSVVNTEIPSYMGPLWLHRRPLRSDTRPLRPHMGLLHPYMRPSQFHIRPL